MGTAQRTPAHFGVTRTTALAGAFVLGAALVLSPSAVADPIPVEPAPVEPAPTPAPIFGVLGLPDISAYGSTPLLGQNPIPSAPGALAPAVAPDLNAFNNQYLLPLNTLPAAPDQGTDPGAQAATTTRLDYLKRLYSMYQDGQLKGSLLGQLPLDQLGEPLPGTAPTPGIGIPPGLGLNLPELMPPLALDDVQ